MALKGKNVNFVLIYLVSFTAAFVLLYFLAGAPVFKFEKERKAEFGKKQERLRKLQELIVGMPDPAKAIEEIDKKSKDFKEGASKKQLPRTIQMLAKAAGENNVDLVSVRPREDIKPPAEIFPGVNKAYIEMTINCSFQKFAEFTRALGELPGGNFSIESFTIEKKKAPEGADDKKAQQEKAPAEEKAGELSINMLISTYIVWHE